MGRAAALVEALVEDAAVVVATRVEVVTAREVAELRANCTKVGAAVPVAGVPEGPKYARYLRLARN